MRAPLSWIRELADLPAGLSNAELATAFTRAGLQVEHIECPADAITGPVVVGQVLDLVEEPQKNGKTIRWCHVDCGPHNPESEPSRGIVCGALNFAVGDFVAVALDGAVLPGGFAIAARRTYGHVSDGMICAADELGLGDDHSGIIVLGHADAAGDFVPGSDALEVLGAYDAIFEIDVTPDEGYCLSIRGLAREAAQAFGVAFHDPYLTPVPAPSQAGYPVVLNSASCATFSAVSIHNVDPNAPTPPWMSSRLVACGVRSLGLRIDITNYVMLESGQPIHGYDAAKLTGPIVVRKAAEGEQIATLDGQLRTLSADDLLITDNTGPIGLAGVMGGQTTELEAETTEVLIEAALFDAPNIGRTYRRHHLASEASRRFERGVDFNLGFAAAARCAELLRDLAGGQIDPAYTVAGSVAPMPVCDVPAGLPSKILGIEVPLDKVVGILQASKVSVELLPDDVLRCTPPTWRRDLVDPYDYVEEIGRKIGFDSIPVVVPRATSGRGLTRLQKARRDVTHALVDAGFVETLTLPFIGEDDIDRLGANAMDTRRMFVRLANPLDDTRPYLRTTLLPGLIAAANRNTSRSQDDLAIFESGKVFVNTVVGEPPSPTPPVDKRPSDDEILEIYASLPDQPHMIAALLTGNWLPATWNAPAEPVTWQHAVAFAETVAAALGLQVTRRAATRAPGHPGRCAEIQALHGDEFVSVGFACELHPDVVKANGLPERSCAVELNLDAMIDFAPENGEVSPLSSFPLTKQDVALVVDATVPAAAVEAALVVGAGDLLESLTLFDVFVGDQIGAGKKSLAYNLRFRHPERTLTEVEATAARDAAVAAAAAATGAVLRG
ncbi:MAG: phenylalanine--tRNA ligase subunit beta [Propionibacteriaceae bacterium]|jgi:phenylalanyl-tRNA synthetase beta chain|nr:phenylalanine--tRNA ligase subunit beta [Propionibacteriaceae bacterium]